MPWNFIIAGAVLLVVCGLWYWWAGSQLQRRGAVACAGGRTGERTEVSLDGLDDLQDLVAKAEHHPRYSCVMIDPSAIMRASKTSGAAAQKISIDRELRIAYSRSIYRDQAFHVDVRIGPHGGSLPALSTEDKEALKETESERLQFQAREEEPVVRVELKFAQGDFSANKSQAERKLSKNAETRFRFLLKPLKDEDCILTVVISYVSTVPALAQVVSKVTIDTTTSGGPDPEKTEHSEQVTAAPAGTTTKVVEVKTVDLLVAVKSLFGMNSREVGLLQKGLGLVVALVLLVIALYAGRVQRAEGLPYLILSIVNMAGIPVYSGLTRLFTKQASDSADA